MKTVVMILFVALSVSSCSPAPVMSGEATTSEIEARVEGVRFSFEPRLPVIPRDGEFTIVSRWDPEAEWNPETERPIARFVLSDFETVQFEPGEEDNLGVWRSAAEGPYIMEDSLEGGVVEFVNGDVKTFRLTPSQSGERQMLAFKVTLFDEEGRRIAEFVDPWDIQP